MRRGRGEGERGRGGGREVQPDAASIMALDLKPAVLQWPWASCIKLLSLSFNICDVGISQAVGDRILKGSPRFPPPTTHTLTILPSVEWIRPRNRGQLAPKTAIMLSNGGGWIPHMELRS